LIEIGVRANNLASNTQLSPLNSSGLDIRHEALYLKSKNLGTVWLGWTSSAADGITEICLGCGLHNGPDPSDDMGNLTTGFQSFDLYGGGHGAFVGEGDRREVIRYISPEFAGFVFSSAYGQDDFYDVALRYANEWNGVRVAAGIAYQYDSSGITGGGPISASSCGTYNVASPLTPANNGSDAECESIGASASVQHVPTGLYMAAAYGIAFDNRAPAGVGDENWGWHITGGVNRKWSPIGATNIWGMYTYQENDVGFVVGDENLTVYGVGIEQDIDAAAMKIYAHWKRMEAEAFGFEEGTTDQFVIGSLIRF
jgi:predicted porin